MSVALRLKQLLDEARVPYKVEVHPPAYTAEEVAEAMHVSGASLAKVVVVVADARHVIAVVPANHRLDLSALATILGASSLRLATEAEFAAEFPDCEVGAMPPFGNLYSLETFAAMPLKRQDRIYFNAGTHREVVQMSREDWERLAKPHWGEFSRTAP